MRVAFGWLFVLFLFACNGAGDRSPLGATRSALTTGTVTNVAAVPGNAKVALSWDAYDGAAAYVVFWATSAALIAQGVDSSYATSTTSYTVTSNLQNGTAEHFLIEALDADGNMLAESGDVSATPQQCCNALTNPDLEVSPASPNTYGTTTTFTFTFGATDNLADDTSQDYVDIVYGCTSESESSCPGTVQTKIPLVRTSKGHFSATATSTTYPPARTTRSRAICTRR